MTELNYEELRKLYRTELNSSKLTQIEPDFFEKLKKLVDVQKKSYQKALTDGQIVYAHDLSNTKKLVDEIIALREKKILGKVLLANKIETTDQAHLSLEERKVFEEMVKLIENYRNLFHECFSERFEKTNGSSSESEFQAESAEPFNKVGIRILKDVPSFMGADMQEYGPFTAGATLELPDKTANLLIHRKFAETV